MRSKAPLALMEQVIMVLVFALAAALCLRVFVLSDQTSRQNEARDRAVQIAQNAAEILKESHGEANLYDALGAGGMWNGNGAYLYFDENWQGLYMEQAEQTVYTLHIGPTGLSVPSVNGFLLAKCEITVWEGETCLFTLPVAWQEVNGDG